MKMKCCYLETEPLAEALPRCAADKNRCVSALFEFSEYSREICRGKKHTICPVFKRNACANPALNA